MVWFSNDVVKANIKGDGLIKAWREYKGMFQEKLAKKADVKKPSVLARMEKNWSQSPDHFQNWLLGYVPERVTDWVKLHSQGLSLTKQLRPYLKSEIQLVPDLVPQLVPASP